MRKLLAIICLLPSLAAMALSTPYKQSFDNTSSLNDFKIIDANSDGNTFHFYYLLDQITGENNGCACNNGQKNGVDDWIVLPGLTLLSTGYYEFSADIRGFSDKWNETFEIYVGTGNTVAKLTEKIMDATTIKHNDYRNYKCGFKPSKSGTYYFAIRHINAGDSYALLIDNISVVKSSTEAAPSMPEMTVTPDWNGALAATVSFTTPTKSLSGIAISSLIKAEVFRDGALIHTIDNPAVGEAYSYTDSGMEKGYHEYSVCVTSEKGTGPKATESRWCGVTLPNRPVSCKVVETENPGEVTVTWDPVTTDVDGNPMNTDLISYVVLQIVNGEYVYRGWRVKGESLTFYAMGDGLDQDIFYGGVYAITDEGYSKSAPGTEYLFIGKPYALPFRESYANGVPTYLFGGGRTSGNGGQLSVMRDGQTDIPSQDGDNGFAAVKIDYKESSVKLCLGKFDLNGISAELRFWYYAYVEDGEDSNTIDVWVTDHADKTRHEVATFETTGPAKGQWYEAALPLTDFTGKLVTIELNVACVSRVYTMIDNISIVSTLDGVESVSPVAPQQDTVFDLQGRRLSSPRRGLNIINGKKVIR